MNFKFVNHASLIIDVGSVKIITDPWLNSTAFNDGWSLLVKSAPVNWDEITHIWISHEHPDHFHVPSLKSIPIEAKNKIIVLYQKTTDRKVRNWLTANGFTCRELTESRDYVLSDNVKIRTGSTPQDDSWLLIDDGKTRFVNMNDCETKSPSDPHVMSHYASKIGTVDVFASQFTWASYIGPDEEFRAAVASELFEKIAYQAECLGAKFFIPFASFSYFSHPESFAQNFGNNKVHDVVSYMNENTACESIVLYPGDDWSVGRKFENAASLTKYKRAYDLALRAPLKDKTKTFDFNQLRLKAELYLYRMNEKNMSSFLTRLKPIDIWITDLSKQVTLSFEGGLVISKRSRAEANFETSSDLIATWFDWDYGGTTIYISGRLHYNDTSRYREAYEYFFISNGNNRGESWPLFSLKRRIRVRLLMFKHVISKLFSR